MSGADVGALSPLGALLAFRDVQRKRTEYWHEYGDAIDAHLRWRRQAQDEDEQEEEARRADGQAGPAARTAHSCAHAAGLDMAAIQDSHENEEEAIKDVKQAPRQDGTVPEELNEAMLLQILNLVTQGLLSCAHETRLLEAHLAQPGRQDQSAGASPGLVPQPALARLLGTVQGLENSLLRTTVRQDQLRTGALYGVSTSGKDNVQSEDQAEDVPSELARLQRERDEIRHEINEAMAEVQAEIAELQLLADEDAS